MLNVAQYALKKGVELFQRASDKVRANGEAPAPAAGAQVIAMTDYQRPPAMPARSDALEDVPSIQLILQRDHESSGRCMGASGASTDEMALAFDALRAEVRTGLSREICRKQAQRDELRKRQIGQAGLSPILARQWDEMVNRLECQCEAAERERELALAGQGIVEPCEARLRLGFQRGCREAAQALQDLGGAQ